MEPIQPAIPWKTVKELEGSPEAELLCAVIQQAWFDANRRFNSPLREKARKWFFLEDFENYCNLIGLRGSVIQEYAKGKWE